MDDGFGLGLRITGRASTPLVFDIERELCEEDLALLAAPRASQAPPIKKLRERHHALARMLAQGAKPGTAGLLCGYSASRVSILTADSAFAELVEFYRGAETERHVQHRIVLEELSLDALEEIREKLETEDLTLGEVMEIAKMTLDRAGFGPSSKSEVNVKIGLADRMAAGQKRLNELREMRDITPQAED